MFVCRLWPHVCEQHMTMYQRQQINFDDFIEILCKKKNVAPTESTLPRLRIAARKPPRQIYYCQQSRPLSHFSSFYFAIYTYWFGSVSHFETSFPSIVVTRYTLVHNNKTTATASNNKWHNTINSQIEIRRREIKKKKNAFLQRRTNEWALTIFFFGCYLIVIRLAAKTPFRRKLEENAPKTMRKND